MKKRDGFSLLELLVATAISLLLVVLLMGVLGASIDIWEHGRNRLDTYANARAVLDRFSDELAGARATDGGLQFVENAASLNTVQTPAVEPVVVDSSENLFFIAPHPNAASGDLCVIAYRHNLGALRLERAFVGSKEAWDLTDPAKRYTLDGYPNLKWVPVSNGVLAFEVKCFSQADIGAANPPTPTVGSSNPKGWKSQEQVGRVPRRVAIRLKTVDDRTMAKIAGLTPGDPTFQRLTDNAAREFIRSVNLAPKP